MAYASLDELKDRLDRDLDAAEQRMAEAALEDATALAIEYGRDWPEDDPPRLVRTLVLRAARRFVENPNGFTVSRAGDETVQWSDAAGENAGSVYFTREEQKLLSALAGRAQGIVSATVSAWRPQRHHGRRMTDAAGYVPAAGMPGSEIPYFACEDSPW